MYEIALALHSWLRWIVLLAGILVVVRSFTRAAKQNDFDSTDKKLGIVFVSAFDTQIILGLVLYFVWSPLVQSALAQGGAMMKDPTLRYWGVEHIFTMLLAMLVMHIGRVFAKRAPTSPLRHKRIALTTLVALLLVLSRIPWPFLAVGRPWFRM